MQIGEMLVRAKAVTPADLDEAVSWQVLYGGRLGTNLLELGLVEEKILAECLGRQLACEWTHGEIDIPENMVQAVPSVVARRHEIIPWRLEGKKFKILCIEPQANLALFDDIGFRLGKLVKPVVVPEFRIHQALRRFFGSVRQMRALDFGVKPKGKRAQDAEKKAEQEALEKSADLMDDDAFAAIYAQVMEQRGGPPQAAAAPPPAPTPVPAPAPAPVAAPPASAIPPGWNAAPPPRVAAQPPPARPAPIAPVAPVVPVAAVEERPLLVPVAEEEELPLLEAEIVEDDEATETAPEGEDTGLQQSKWAAAFADLEQQITANEPPPPPPEDLSPLSFKEAVAAIGKAEGREGVARAVLRYARSKAARAVLLNVQGDVALGWDAVGEELTPDLARRIAFPLTVPSAFRLVRESRSHYIGPLGKDSGNVRFLKLAGKKWPASAVLLPVLFRSKVVYILYVDNGHKQQVNPEVGELLILSQNITRSMEQLVAKRQAVRR